MQRFVALILILIALLVMEISSNLVLNRAQGIFTPWVAFDSARNGNLEIYRMLLDGSSLENLTRNPEQDGSQNWSADGRAIVFTSRRDGNDEIYRMNSNGSGQQRLTQNLAKDMLPQWSPDGQWIAFISERDG